MTDEPQAPGPRRPAAVQGEWDIRFGTSEAAKGWDELSTHTAGSTRRAFELMRANPRPPEDGTHYRLRGDLATRDFAGRALEQWQIKVSGAGRIWYLPDDSKHTVWVVYASPAHPKQTE